MSTTTTPTGRPRCCKTPPRKPEKVCRLPESKTELGAGQLDADRLPGLRLQRLDILDEPVDHRLYPFAGCGLPIPLVFIVRAAPTKRGVEAHLSHDGQVEVNHPRRLDGVA